jgi:hypothetical protein
METGEASSPNPVPEPEPSPLAAAHAAYKQLALPTAATSIPASTTAARVHKALLGAAYAPSASALHASVCTRNRVLGDGECDVHGNGGEAADGADDPRYEIDWGMLADEGEEEIVDGQHDDRHVASDRDRVEVIPCGGQSDANGVPSASLQIGAVSDPNEGLSRRDRLLRPRVDSSGVFLLLDAVSEVCMQRELANTDPPAILTASPRKRPRRRSSLDGAASYDLGAGGTNCSGMTRLSIRTSTFVHDLLERCEGVREEQNNSKKVSSKGKTPSRRDAASAASVVDELASLECKALAGKYERPEDCIADVANCIANQESIFVDVLPIVDELSAVLRSDAREIETSDRILQQLRVLSVGILGPMSVSQSVEKLSKPQSVPSVTGNPGAEKFGSSDRDIEMSESVAAIGRPDLADLKPLAGSEADISSQGATNTELTADDMDTTGDERPDKICGKTVGAGITSQPNPSFPQSSGLPQFPFVSLSHALAAQRYRQLAAVASTCMSLSGVESIWRSYGRSGRMSGDKEIAVVSPFLVEYASLISAASPSLLLANAPPAVSAGTRIFLEDTAPTAIVTLDKKTEPIRDSVAALERIRELRNQMFAAFDPEHANSLSGIKAPSGELAPSQVKPDVTTGGPADAGGSSRARGVPATRSRKQRDLAKCSSVPDFVIRNEPSRARDPGANAETGTASPMPNVSPDAVKTSASFIDVATGLSSNNDVCESHEEIDEVAISAGSHQWASARSVTSLLLAHGGFATSSENAVNILTDLTAEFVERIGRSLVSCREQMSEGKVYSAQQSDQSLDAAIRATGYVQAHKVRTRDETLEFMRIICSSGFRGGFPELQHYVLHDIPRTWNEFRDVEEKVRAKLTEFAALSGTHLPKVNPSPSSAATTSAVPIEALGASPRQFLITSPAPTTEMADPEEGENGADESDARDPTEMIWDASVDDSAGAASVALPLREAARLFGLLAPGTRLDILGDIHVPSSVIFEVIGAYMDEDIPGKQDTTVAPAKDRPSPIDAARNIPQAHHIAPSDAQMVDVSSGH